MNPKRICYGCFQEKEPGSVCPHCGFHENEEQPYLALPLGTLLNGRYMLGKVLGIGGFGITYLGYDLTLEIKVAIKEYMPSSIATRNKDRYNVTLTGRVEMDYQCGMKRFLDEAKILAKLQNAPHIVSVQNYFQENNTAYFVMEYIDGMSLKAYLASQGNKIPYPHALTILQPIMEALIQVHALNLLHRDISPDNIYITSQGESRLLDFGAARFALGDGKSVSVILKHGYAPEEQYSSHGNQGPWTDVYAMGATLYRCITGTLPPDSIERIRKDTLMPPSELGISIPQNVEQAILKALAVKTEDRFSNMSAFLRALTGRISVQEQVAASVSERTQASAFHQAIYDGSNATTQKSNTISKFITYLKANPVIAWASGGGLLLVIALCIILPFVFSSGEKTTPPGGSASDIGSDDLSDTNPGDDGLGDDGLGDDDLNDEDLSDEDLSDEDSEDQDPSTITTPDETPDSEPEQPDLPVSTIEMETRDLGILNASVDIPSDYTVSEDGFTFIHEEKGYALSASFIWNVGDPVYSLSDIETNRDWIVEALMAELEVTDYTILAADSDSIGGQEAYQIYFEGTGNDGVSMDMIYMAIQGNSAFGCYTLFGAYPKGDEAGKEEICKIMQTFQSNGIPDTTYSMWYSENIGIKIIIDDAIALGSVWETEIQLEDSVAEVIVIYPTEAAKEAGLGNIDSPDSGGIEVGYVSEYGYQTPEELLDAHADSAIAAGGTVGERYTAALGGAEWLCQDYTIGSFNFSSAAAVIDGQCFYLSAMYNASNQEAVTTLCNQVLASVRPW